jgi:hypothetical protein
MIGAVTAAVTKDVAYPITGYVNVLGSEVLTNGAFDGAGEGWSVQSGWTLGGGVATGEAGASSSVNQEPPLTIGIVYRTTWTVALSAGGIQLLIGTTTGTLHTGGGTFTEDVECAGNGFFQILKDTSFVGTVDNVSCKEVL